MTSKPFFSVIIATYNVEKFIVETLNSVKQQTYTNFEVIFADDGSTDKTTEIISEQIINDKRFSLFSLNHSGNPAIPRNFAFKKAIGEYLCILDSDDLWHKDKLLQQYLYLSKYPEKSLVYSACISFGDVNILSQKYELLPLPFRYAKNYSQLLTIGNTIGTSTTAFKRNLAEKFGYFDEDPDINEDYDLWLKLSSAYKIGFIPLIQTKYRIHSTQNSGNWKVRVDLIDNLAKKRNIKLNNLNLMRDKGFVLLLVRNSIHYLSFIFYLILSLFPYKLLLKLIK